MLSAPSRVFGSARRIFLLSNTTNHTSLENDPMKKVTQLAQAGMGLSRPEALRRAASRDQRTLTPA
jgi:hypothetical protein